MIIRKLGILVGLTSLGCMVTYARLALAGALAATLASCVAATDDRPVLPPADGDSMLGDQAGFLGANKRLEPGANEYVARVLGDNKAVFYDQYGWFDISCPSSKPTRLVTVEWRTEATHRFELGLWRLADYIDDADPQPGFLSRRDGTRLTSTECHADGFCESYLALRLRNDTFVVRVDRVDEISDGEGNEVHPLVLELTMGDCEFH